MVGGAADLRAVLFDPKLAAVEGWRPAPHAAVGLDSQSG